MDQLEIHNTIDSLLLGIVTSASPEKVRVLISFNRDAYIYFFSRADERWVDWLWSNDFLSILKNKDGAVKDGYRTPEIDYLVKVSDKEPAKVTNIILDVPVTEKNFNPDVVGGFLRIIGKLPANEIKRVVKKICDEQWIPKMGALNDWGFDYADMFKRLSEAHDYASVITLTEAVLSVKPEYDERTSGYMSDNPFYFKELIYTEVFNYLLKVDGENQDKALALAIGVMSKVTALGTESDEGNEFKVRDSFAFYDVDFFELDLIGHNAFHRHDDIKNLAYIIKYFSQKVIGEKCGAVSAEIYERYFGQLPDSQSMWRLRLFVLTLCPTVFGKDLKKAFFRLFEAKRYVDIMMGAEYLTALQKCFSALSDEDRRSYVGKVIKLFLALDNTKTDEKEDWHLKYGSKILSVISSSLTPEENDLASKSGFKIDSKFKPRPSIGSVETAWGVTSRGPIPQEEFSSLPISEIAKKLRNEWSPEELVKRNTSDDFHSPLNGEGAGALLCKDIYKRTIEYIENSSLFFERDTLNAHYTYSFLKGIQETIKNKAIDVNVVDLNKLFAFCLAIRGSGNSTPFDTETKERGSFDSWLAGWTAVHSTVADLLQGLLDDGCFNDISFNLYRQPVFDMIEYLLSFLDPIPDNEKLESASIKSKAGNSNEYTVGDPFTMAINSVRGLAFQAFVSFVIRDVKNFPKEENIKIAQASKELYESSLAKEDTRAIMFMFGYYLPTFYFRDKEWSEKLFPSIFPSSSEKKNLYTAAWEGYVTTGVYEELFFNPKMQALYLRGLQLTEADYPKQNHFKDPDEGIAVHIALSYVHFSEFGLESDLFKKFWASGSPKEQEEFVSFIGRHAMTRSSVLDWIKYNHVDIEKVKAFWDWALVNCSPAALSGFGSWITDGETPLDVRWLAERLKTTLAKTNGYLEWTHGLNQMLPRMAKESPEDTLSILRYYLLEEVAKHQPVRTWIYIDREIKDALAEIYTNENSELKAGVKALIDDLLPWRDGMFWRLKSVLEKV